MPADCPTAERVRDALLVRFDVHLNRPEVRAELLARLDVSPAVLTRIVQRVAEVLFAECFDLDDGPHRGGLVGRQGPARVGRDRLEAFAASIGV